jgi:hypothetical protein
MKDVGFLTVIVYISGKFDTSIFKGKYGHSYTISQERNQPCNYGRYRGSGTLSDTSSCFFEFGEKMKHEEKIKSAVEVTLRIKNDFEKENIEIDYFSFGLLYTGYQGNMELSSEEIKWLSKLDGGISMTYINASDFDYRKQRRLRRLKAKLYSEGI